MDIDDFFENSNVKGILYQYYFISILVIIYLLLRIYQILKKLSKVDKMFRTISIPTTPEKTEKTNRYPPPIKRKCYTERERFWILEPLYLDFEEEDSLNEELTILHIDPLKK